MVTPEIDALHLIGYVFLMTDKLEKALSVFEGLAEMQPESEYVHKLLAFTYLRLKRYGQALPEAERALAGGAQSHEGDKLLLMKAHALWGLGRKEEADRVVEQFFAARAARRGGQA